MRTGQVAGHHAGGEAVVAVVGPADHFLFAVVDQDAHHRAEDFLTDDAHGVAAVGEHGRRHVGALGVVAVADPLAADQQARALAAALGDVAEHAFHMGEADQRAEVGGLNLRVAQADAFDPIEHLALETRLQHARHEHPGAVGADLAGAVEVGHDRDVGGAVEVGVLEDDQRRLAAQLHGHFLEGGTGGAGHDLLAGAGAAGEGNLLDPRVFGQPLADFAAAAGEHVEHAVRQAGLAVDLGQFEDGERGDFAGLEDHRVAGGQGRGGLPQGDLDRVVPGADAGNHAQRLAAGVDEAGVAQGDLLAFDGGHQAGVILEHVGAGDDVDEARLRQRLAGVEGFQFGQLVVTFPEDIHRLAQDPRALHGGHRRPDLLPGARAGHGAVDVGLAGALHLGQHFTVGRVDAFEGDAAGRIDIAAADVELLFVESGHGRVLCCRLSWQGWLAASLRLGQVDRQVQGSRTATMSRPERVKISLRYFY
ncbi:hypothetical protein D3C84_592510 [compost metagenome]